MMTKLIYAITAAAALAIPAMASATTTIPVTDFDGAFGSLSKTVNGNFDFTYTFTVGGPGLVSASVTAAKVSPRSGITFTSILLNGVALVNLSNGQQFFELNDLVTDGGLQTLQIVGSGRGSYGGSVSFAAAAVPEAASWAMMIVGFGLVGGAARQRRSVKLSYAI
jgi:hypothetical protein